MNKNSMVIPVRWYNQSLLYVRKQYNQILADKYVFQMLPIFITSKKRKCKQQDRMSILDFRRNPNFTTKLRKQGRTSENSLLNLTSNQRNLSYLYAVDKENQTNEITTPVKKNQPEAYVFKRNSNTYSLEKQKKASLMEKFMNRGDRGQIQDFGGKSRLIDKIINTQKDIKRGESVRKFEENTTDQDQDKKNLPYFIECFAKKGKVSSQAYINIHLSILTFKNFRRACLLAKPRSPDTKIPQQIQGRKTIVFDMDETLIHTNQIITTGYEIKVPFRSINGRIIYGYVCVRPHAKELLKRLSEHFDILIFTAGSQPYADPILDYIDPHKVVKHRLYRQSCTLVDNQIFVKDLRILGRNLQNVVLVDNAPHTYMMQLNNGIPILPYYKGKQDKQLLSLQKYLMKLKDVDDVRKHNSEHFQLEQYIRYDSREKVVSALYSKFL